MLAVDGDKGGHEGRGGLDLELGVLVGRSDIQRLGRKRHLAFVALEFLQAHVGVRGDRVDQRPDRRFAAEVLRVGLVAHLRVLLEAFEHERAGTYRLRVELLWGACLEQLIGVFSRVDRGKAHAQGGQEGRIRMAQGEAHGVRVAGIDRFDQATQLQRLRVRVAAGRGLVPGVSGVEHALEAEQHIVGVQGPAWLEVGGAVEFGVVTQLEVVHQTVGRDRPAQRQAWHHFALLGIEFDQTVHQHVGRGIGGSQRVVLHHVEAFRAGFGTHHQWCGLGEAGQQQAG